MIRRNIKFNRDFTIIWHTCSGEKIKYWGCIHSRRRLLNVLPLFVRTLGVRRPSLLSFVLNFLNYGANLNQTFPQSSFWYIICKMCTITPPDKQHGPHAWLKIEKIGIMQFYRIISENKAFRLHLTRSKSVVGLLPLYR